MASPAKVNPSQNIGNLITRSNDTKSGRPYIAGTGVMVMRVAAWYKLGWNPDEIARQVDLTLAQVHAAITYYHANPEEIEAQISEEQALYEEAMLKHLQSEIQS